MDTKYSSLFGLRAMIARRLNIPKITDFLAKPTGCQAIIGDAFASAMLIWHVEHHVISDKAAAGWTMACDEVAGRHKNRAIDDRNFSSRELPRPFRPRERKTQSLRSARSGDRLFFCHSTTYNIFNVSSHLTTAGNHRVVCSQPFDAWKIAASSSQPGNAILSCSTWAFRVISGMGDCTGPLLLHVATEKIVEGGPDYRDRSELADRFPTWSHRS
jgi:hypothetical protein